MHILRLRLAERGWLVVVALSLGPLACGPKAVHLVLATTTSIGNSGLLDALLPAFHAQQGVTVRTHLVGSGLALKMLADGHADLVISHAPEAEHAALRAHSTWRYTKIMFNDFVIVGPRNDPAVVRSASSAQEAMRRIAESPARFLSRGDQSGTHEREQRLWTVAGTQPAATRLVIAGAGMGTALQIAGELGAYTLTDRATFAQHARSTPLAVVFEGGRDLVNSYAVIVDPAGPNAHTAGVLAEWLANGDGRSRLDQYRINGQQGFRPWPPDRPRHSPHDTPR